MDLGGQSISCRGDSRGSKVGEHCLCSLKEELGTMRLEQSDRCGHSALGPPVPITRVLKTLGRTLNFILNVRRSLEGLKKEVLYHLNQTFKSPVYLEHGGCQAGEQEAS